MHTKAVIVTCDVEISWKGTPPTYRLWVNDELFTERTYDWTRDFFLREQITIEGPYNLYQIRYELLPHKNATILVSNPQVVSGPAKWRKNLQLVIHDENF